MKNTTMGLIMVLAISLPLHAQTGKKTVYGEVGLGFGQTLFAGDIRTKLRQSLGGSFEPGTGNNLLMGFYVAPETWRGLGIGSRIRGTFGAPVTGEFGDKYIFNYYNLAVSAKYYAISRQYNRGFYGRGSIGFGQLTTKRQNEAARQYTHQYAIGSSLMGGIGYTRPFRKTSLSIEAEYERSSRQGTINGVGDNQSFRSGQLGINLYVTF